MGILWKLHQSVWSVDSHPVRSSCLVLSGREGQLCLGKAWSLTGVYPHVFMLPLLPSTSQPTSISVLVCKGCGPVQKERVASKYLKLVLGSS